MVGLEGQQTQHLRLTMQPEVDELGAGVGRPSPLEGGRRARSGDGVAHDQGPSRSNRMGVSPRLSARTLGRQMSVGPRPRDGVVPCDPDQHREEGIAGLARGTGELRKRVLCGCARYELTIADGERLEHHEALVVLRQVLHDLS